MPTPGWRRSKSLHKYLCTSCLPNTWSRWLIFSWLLTCSRMSLAGCQWWIQVPVAVHTHYGRQVAVAQQKLSAACSIKKAKICSPVIQPIYVHTHGCSFDEICHPCHAWFPNKIGMQIFHLTSTPKYLADLCFVFYMLYYPSKRCLK